MKENKRKFDLLIGLGIIQLEDFYSISINLHDLCFQGDYNSRKVARLKKVGFEFIINDHNYVIAQRNDIRIVLTD